MSKNKQATLFQSWGNHKKESVGVDETKNAPSTSGGGDGGFIDLCEDDDDDDLLLQALNQSVNFDLENQWSEEEEDAQPTKRGVRSKNGNIQSGKVSKPVDQSGDVSGHDQDVFNISMGVDLAETTQGHPTPSQYPNLPGFDKAAGKIWIYPTNYPVRDYQYNIVQQALFKNTMVTLPTGLGKTFISAVVMYNFYRWYPQGKVVFMAPTKPLVAQQIEACYNIMGIPQSDTAEMTGSMGPPKREKAWHEKRVFFLTPQVLTNDLSRGTCPAELVKCLVVDEAHKALGNHAYCQVVKELIKYTQSFRVLALSATPGSDIKAVQQVLTNLLISHIELRTEESIDIKQYSHERKVEKVVVPLGDELSGVKTKYIKILDVVVNRLKRNGVLYNKPTTSFSKFLILKARDGFRQNPPERLQRTQYGIVEGDFALAMSLYHGYELLQLHGSRSLFNFLDGIITGDKGHGRTRTELMKNADFNDLMETLGSKFSSEIRPSQMVRPSQGGKPFVAGHPKMEKLQEIVLEHFSRYKDNKENGSSGCATRIMIFSQYRDSVTEIKDMLNIHRPLVKVMSFIGQSSAGKATKGFTQKEQLKVMKQFREGGYNTLVSTCVGEEGLDIGDVDLIICFDAHKSPIRLVQRMGRTGRKREGRIVMLVTQGKEEQIYNQSQYSKKSIHKAILNGARSLHFYPHNPRMVPEHYDPTPHKMYITVRETFKPTKKITSEQPEKNKITSMLENKENKLDAEEVLTADEYKELLDDGDLDLVAGSDVPQLVGFSDFLCLKDSGQETPVTTGTVKMLSVNEWLPWQNQLQPTHHTDHSLASKHYVELMEFIELQQTFDANDDPYGLEMAAYLNEEDILKPGEVDSTADNGILKFCKPVATDAGMRQKGKKRMRSGKETTDEEAETSGVQTEKVKKKFRRSDLLPELVTMGLEQKDSDDDLPAFDIAQVDKGGSSTVKNSEKDKTKNKITKAAFDILSSDEETEELSIHDKQKNESKSVGPKKKEVMSSVKPEVGIKKKKKSRHSSGRSSIISVIADTDANDFDEVDGMAVLSKIDEGTGLENYQSVGSGDVVDAGHDMVEFGDNEVNHHTKEKRCTADKSEASGETSLLSEFFPNLKGSSYSKRNNAAGLNVSDMTSDSSNDSIQGSYVIRTPPSDTEIPSVLSAIGDGKELASLDLLELVEEWEVEKRHRESSLKKNEHNTSCKTPGSAGKSLSRKRSLSRGHLSEEKVVKESSESGHKRRSGDLSTSGSSKKDIPVRKMSVPDENVVINSKCSGNKQKNTSLDIFLPARNEIGWEPQAGQGIVGKSPEPLLPKAKGFATYTCTKEKARTEGYEKSEKSLWVESEEPKTSRSAPVLMDHDENNPLMKEKLDVDTEHADNLDLFFQGIDLTGGVNRKKVKNLDTVKPETASSRRRKLFKGDSISAGYNFDEKLNSEEHLEHKNDNQRLRMNSDILYRTKDSDKKLDITDVENRSNSKRSVGLDEMLTSEENLIKNDSSPVCVQKSKSANVSFKNTFNDSFFNDDFDADLVDAVKTQKHGSHQDESASQVTFTQALACLHSSSEHSQTPASAKKMLKLNPKESQDSQLLEDSHTLEEFSETQMHTINVNCAPAREQKVVQVDFISSDLHVSAMKCQEESYSGMPSSKSQIKCSSSGLDKTKTGRVSSSDESNEGFDVPQFDLGFDLDEDIIPPSPKPTQSSQMSSLSMRLSQSRLSQSCIHSQDKPASGGSQPRRSLQLSGSASGSGNIGEDKECKKSRIGLQERRSLQLTKKTKESFVGIVTKNPSEIKLGTLSKRGGNEKCGVKEAKSRNLSVIHEFESSFNDEDLLNCDKMKLDELEKEQKSQNLSMVHEFELSFNGENLHNCDEVKEDKMEKVYSPPVGIATPIQVSTAEPEDLSPLERFESSFALFQGNDLDDWIDEVDELEGEMQNPTTVELSKKSVAIHETSREDCKKDLPLFGKDTPSRSEIMVPLQKRHSNSTPVARVSPVQAVFKSPNCSQEETGRRQSVEELERVQEYPDHHSQDWGRYPLDNETLSPINKDLHEQRVTFDTSVTSPEHKDSDLDDSSIVRRKKKVAILTSPESQGHNSSQQDPFEFRTPGRPAGSKLKLGRAKSSTSSESDGQGKNYKRSKQKLPPVTWVDDDDFASPSTKRGTKVKALEESSEEETNVRSKSDLVNCRKDGSKNQTSAYAGKGKNKQVKKKKDLNQFIDHEATLSDEDADLVSSDEDCDSDMDQYDASFVNDATQCSQGVDHAVMHAMYLKSVRSPPLASRGRFKLQYEYRDVDVYSQLPQEDEEESQYMEDSFCVGDEGEEEDSFLHLGNDGPEGEITLVEEVSIIKRKRTRRQTKLAQIRERLQVGNKRSRPGISANIGKAPGRRRIHRLEESSEEEEEVKLVGFTSPVNVTCLNEITKPATKQSKFVISSSEDEFQATDLKNISVAKVGNSRISTNAMKAAVMEASMKKSAEQIKQERLKRQKEKQEEFRRKFGNRLSLQGKAATLNIVNQGVESSEWMCTKQKDDRDDGMTKLKERSARVGSQGTAITRSVLDNSNKRLRMETEKPGSDYVDVFKHDQDVHSSVVTKSKKKMDGTDSDAEFDSGDLLLVCPDTSRHKGKAVILVDSREISGAQDIVSDLRFKHNIYVSAAQLAGCDYILSNRMAVDRKQWSEFSNGSNRAKLIERMQHLGELYDRPCLIVEKDRVKAGEEKSTRPLHWTKYVDRTLALLLKSEIKVLFTDNQQETSALLADLCQLEQRKGVAISVSVDLNAQQQNLAKFLSTFPKMSYVHVLNLCAGFRTLSELVHSPISAIQRKGQMSEIRAAEIQKYMLRTFDSNMLPSNIP